MEQPRSKRLVRTSHRQAFTLVETLMILAVISVLAVATFAPFGSLRSTSLSSAGNQIVDFVTMARQNSISKNAYTAIVIQKSGSSAFNAHCLMQLLKNDDGSYGSWTMLTPWKFLPGGVIFEPTTPTTDFLSTSTVPAYNSPPYPSSPFGSLTFQGSQFTGSTAYQIYQPDGTLMGGQPLRLRMVQGTADNVNNPANTTVIGTDYYDLVFVANSGIAIIQRP